MKCPICATKKGKRTCLLTASCICSSCCGNKRTKDICYSCVYYQEPKRNYKIVPAYSPSDMANSGHLLKIAYAIESSLHNFDLSIDHELQDQNAIDIFEHLIDIYFFKDDSHIENPITKIGVNQIENSLQEEFGEFNEDTIKVLSGIYFVAKRRTKGRREYLSFIQQYV